MTSAYRQRAEFEKAVLAGLAKRIKGTRWRKSRSALFVQSGDTYQDIAISVHRNAPRTTALLRFKPMALDPILWDILGIRENGEEALSFRTWGAFTCPGLPLAEPDVESFGDSVADVSGQIVSFALEQQEAFRSVLATQAFSDAVSHHPNQQKRGAYAVTLVVALINEGQIDRAFRLAESYAHGDQRSCFDLTSGGTSFHQLALGWLSAGKRSKGLLGAIADV
jgi:hypothetical protein